MSEDAVKYLTLRPCSVVTRVVTTPKRTVWLSCLKELNHEGPHAFRSDCPSCGHDLLDTRPQPAVVAMIRQPSAKRCSKLATTYYVGTLVAGGPWARTKRKVPCGLVEGHEGEHQP